MNEDKKTLIEREIDARKQAAIDALLDEIFAAYKPHTGEGEADFQPTSVELANNISETIAITAHAVAIAMTIRGYHTKLRGSLFRWQIDLND